MNIAWPDFAAALGLLLVVEGILPFLNPHGIKRLLAVMAAMDDGALRVGGAVSMLAGLLLLWLVRS
ncbi:MAG TPA: DUF2065 domain-containing protein [Steroidobacteraceae bacterium]